MKIMIITLNTKGGMVHYVSQLANSLAKREDVVVIAPIGIDKNNFDINHVKIIELKMGNLIKNFIVNTLIFTRPLKFIRSVYRENPDIIHFNEIHLWAALFLPYLRKFKIVTMIHDVNPHIGGRMIDQKFAKRIYVKFSDCLLVHGKYAKKLIKTNKKVYSIPHGDYSFFLNYSEDKIDEEKDTILFFGRIIDYKGLNYLIESVNYILNQKPEIKLIIAGSGNFDKYNHLIKNHENFEIHNRFIKDEEVSSFFQRAKIVILPYIEGTQTGIIPIAYAFKKPVIATDVGSIPEVVENGKTGFIVPSKNSIALAEAIIKTLDDENLQKRMGVNGYIKMRKELSWDVIAGNLIQIYNKLRVE
ncbi:glycosyltransferase family 4 protein [Methanobacterium spitsbergense]|uniref:Glycosyltransferase family 4 protein n=1 Tax=Methanobacterium spitsbergense TaxID=2874285 RepID=A0A8T5UQP9_9EURY|nr:glycosyltransferase family 4 protein [Methanobacterium spitsbergense]MBZ2166312.1 glycosyltransferase family 4 protein [Methanobacterium spitsbergense]